MYGRHENWQAINALKDCAWTLIFAKALFPEVGRISVSFTGPTDSPCFVVSDNSGIPSLEAPDSSATQLKTAFSESSLCHVEHHSFLRLCAQRLGGFGALLNYWAVADYELARTDEIDYELQSLKINSVGWRSRYDAQIVSEPRDSDLDDSRWPTQKYLNSLFAHTTKRWATRSHRRPYGTSRLKVFCSAIITVFRQYLRRSHSSNKGISPDLAFRFEWAIFRPVCPTVAGFELRRVGPFLVSAPREGIARDISIP